MSMRRDYAHCVVKPNRLLPWVAFASVCFFWGTTSPAIRYAVRYFPPLMLSGTRFALAGSLLLLTLVVLRQSPTRWSVVIQRCVPGGLALAAANSLTCIGFRTVESGQGAFLLATTALWMSIIDGLWPSGARRASRLAWLGLVVGLAGVALLIEPHGTVHGSMLGGALLLLSSLSWALSSVWQSRHPSYLPPLLEAAVQMLIASIVTLPIAYLIGERWQGNLPASAWGAFMFLVLTGSLIGFVSFVVILRQLPPKIVGLYTYVNPLVATWAGWWWLDELVHPRLLPASVLVLGSVALVRLAEARRTRLGPGAKGISGDPSLTPLEPSA
jgi:drug/metabolite transporter (DMT)-like permease